MRRVAVSVMALFVAGCASIGKDEPPLAPEVPRTPKQADARTRADLHTQLGAGYFELRNFGVALEELNEALRADPNYSPAHNMLGVVYMELGEDARAERSFQRALEVSPTDSDAHNNYGWFLCQRKRYDEAAKHFAEALRNPLYPTPEKTFINAGLCARQQGNEAAARDFFERALQRQPNHPVALFQIADLSFARADYGSARAFMTRLLRTGVRPTAEALWLALRIERRLGDRSAEASYGLQLRKNFPDSPQTRALLSGQ